MKVEDHQRSSGSVFALLKTPLVAAGMAGASFFFMGQFTLVTYLRPFLETVTRIDIPTLSLLLLTLGTTGFIGTVVIGHVLKRGFYQTLIVIPLTMSIIAGGLIAVGHQVLPVVILLAFWGMAATAAPVGWWSWVAKTLPKNAEAAGGLMVALVQLAIGLGSTIGGVLFDAYGHDGTFTASAELLLLAALLAGITARMDRS